MISGKEYPKELCRGLATEVNGQLTQIDRNQRVEQENNEQTLLTDVKDSNWIEVEL